MKVFTSLILCLTIFLISACNQMENEDSSNPPGTNHGEHEQEPGNDKSNDGSVSDPFLEPYDEKIEHIHGLGYPGQAGELVLASHHGLLIYKKGKWYQTIREKNDYMGFSAVHDGFYASGHPGQGSELPDPLGLIKSSDYGQSITKLGLQGKVDFHVMGVGYNNEAIYAFNTYQNVGLEEGLLYSLDKGENWQAASGEGLPSNDDHSAIAGIAVHPSDSKIVAVYGKEGVFLSDNNGESFKKVTNLMTGTSVFFTEEFLWYGAYDQKPHLIKIALSTGEEIEVNLPPLEEDAVMFMAENPNELGDLIIATYKGDIYHSPDNGETWHQLVKNGEIK